MYGKNIRQGNTFYVKQVNAQLIARNEGSLEDFDTGGAATLQLKMYQTNKYNRAAWNSVFKQWSTQKRLGGAVGAAIKNDDMEFAFNYFNQNSRTSTIYQNMADEIPEKLVLGGTSTAGQDFSLEDFCNTTMFPIQEPSKDHFDNSVYKENKFDDNRMGDHLQIELGMHNSSVVTDIGGLEIGGVNVTPGRALSGASVGTAQYEAPYPIPVLCGLMEYYCLITPPDTASQVADDFFIRIQIHLARWKPLVYRSRKSRRKYNKPVNSSFIKRLDRKYKRGRRRR